MRWRICLGCAVLAVAAAPARGQDQQPEPTIAPGVSAGGVDLSNLTVEQATAKLNAELGPALAQDLLLGAAGRPFKLTMADARLHFDAAATARRALATPAPPPPQAGGTGAGAVVPLALRHSRRAVKAFVARVATQVYRRPRDAGLHLTLRRITTSPSRYGHALDQTATATEIDTTLDTVATRVLHQRLVRVRARVNTLDLARIYSTVITVDRGSFKLRLFKHLRLRKTYGIAVGMAGLDTPAGRYVIHEKEVDPAWHVPNSPWAGSLAGQVIPGGAPNNPLKARWLGIANGVGIHGTAEDWSIGSRASHGCIRMHVTDVIDLYRRVPVGTTVLIR